MPHVLGMATLELRHPVLLLVLSKAHNALLRHCAIPTRSLLTANHGLGASSHEASRKPDSQRCETEENEPCQVKRPITVERGYSMVFMLRTIDPEGIARQHRLPPPAGYR